MTLYIIFWAAYLFKLLEDVGNSLHSFLYHCDGIVPFPGGQTSHVSQTPLKVLHLTVDQKVAVIGYHKECLENTQSYGITIFCNINNLDFFNTNNTVLEFRIKFLKIHV